MALKLKEGKYYVTQDGTIKGPCVKGHISRLSGPSGRRVYYVGSGESDGAYVYWSNGKHVFKAIGKNLVKEASKEQLEANRKRFRQATKYGFPLGSPSHDQAVEDIEVECLKAMTAFPPFNTAHEGYAILLEEVDELWAEVKKKQGSEGRPEAIRKEAIQVAAMALRLILECTDPTKPAYNK